MNTFFKEPQRGILVLIMIVLVLWVSKIFVMGPKKKHQKDNRHPLFGVWTRYIPNLLSFVRFPLGLWIYLVHAFEGLHHQWGFISVHLSFALVAFFDFLDGKFARKWNAISEEGKSIDPLADKAVTFFLAFTAFSFGELQGKGWVLFILIAREVGSMLQRVRMRRKGKDVSAKWLGKIKTPIQFTVLYILVLRIQLLPGSIFLEKVARALPEGLILWLIVLLCFITVISIFPFFDAFSYVNAYEKSQRAESNRAWYIVCVPNVFTIGNYLCGITAVYFSLFQVPVAYRPFVILFWIFLGALFDAFDGPLARKLKSHSEFGACLDSSTDLSTFGLAVGASIFLQFSALRGGWSFLGMIIGALYFTSVHLRLARFTDDLQNQEDKGVKADFKGLPSPAGAFAALLSFTLVDNVYVLSAVIILISVLMYSRMDFISHSNSTRNPFYRFLVIPFLLIGFGLLFILIFQQPFVSKHMNRELKDYFFFTSYLLAAPLGFYLIDGIRRTAIAIKKKK